MMPVDQRWTHADVHGAVHKRGRPHQPNGHTHLLCGAHVAGLDVGDPFEGHISERHARAEGNARQNRHLCSRISAVHVLRRVGLRVAEALSLGKGVRVGGAVLHLGEDVVRRAVDDSEYPVHVGDDERFPEHLDDRDRGTHGRFEPQLYAGAGCGREQVGCALRDQLLVGRDDVLAGAEELQHVVAGRLDSAHHLGHHGDVRVVANVLERPGQDLVGGSEAPLLVGIANECLHHTQPVARGPLDVVGALGQEPVDSAADCPIPEQADRNVNGSHGSPVRRQTFCISARSSLPTCSMRRSLSDAR